MASCRTRHARRRGCRWQRWTIANSPRIIVMVIAMRGCRRCAKPGGADWPRWMPPRKPAPARRSIGSPMLHAMRCSRTCTTASSTVRNGAACRAKCSFASASPTTSSPRITRTRPRGTKSASAARPARAATCECISIGAILGKRQRRIRRRRARPMKGLHDALHTPRGKNGRAPDPLRVGGWMPMREYRDNEQVDFVIVGTGAGGGTLACKLAEAGFSVVALDAGAWWRPLEEFASDETHQEKLFWTDERICDGDNPLKLGSNNSGKSVGGSTVHFAMVSLRFRPEWFKCRTLLGYGVDWPVDWREMWHYYGEVVQALKISGPITYPWGPKRPRYPYRAHEVNAAGWVLAKGCEALGIEWTETPLATISAPRGQAHPCVYRGFCVTGCSTNAKQSALITWIPRAIAAGA